MVSEGGSSDLWHDHARVLREKVVEAGRATFHLAEDKKVRQARSAAVLGPARVEPRQPAPAEARRTRAVKRHVVEVALLGNVGPAKLVRLALLLGGLAREVERRARLAIEREATLLLTIWRRGQLR